MKIVARISIVLLMLLIGLWLVQLVASESGEVAVLHTQEKTGDEYSTRLWVVDHEGDMWLRAGTEQANWYQRLIVLPEVEVDRNSDRLAIVAEPQPEYRDEINRLMADKYGWRESYISFFFPRDKSIPVRLVVD